MDLAKIILENKLTASDAVSLVELLTDQAELVRRMAMYVSMGLAGTGDARKELLGDYYEEVQAKVNWAVETAKAVWRGEYGSGDARREKLGEDYDLVQFWVDSMAPHAVPENIKIKKDSGGKRYVIEGVPTAWGVKTVYGYPQGAQGVDNISGSGCGLCSYLAIVALMADSSVMPAPFKANRLEKLTGGSKCPISTGQGLKILDSYNIGYTWVKCALDNENVVSDISAHLRSGRPVIVALQDRPRGGGAEDNTYTDANHYAVLMALTPNGKKALLVDSGKRGTRFVDLVDICRHIPAAARTTKFDTIWNGWSNCGGYVKIK